MRAGSADGYLPTCISIAIGFVYLLIGFHPPKRGKRTKEITQSNIIGSFANFNLFLYAAYKYKY